MNRNKNKTSNTVTICLFWGFVLSTFKNLICRDTYKLDDFGYIVKYLRCLLYTSTLPFRRVFFLIVSILQSARLSIVSLSETLEVCNIYFSSFVCIPVSYTHLDVYKRQL